MPPIEFDVEVRDALTEREARDQAWLSAQLHIGMDRYEVLDTMRLTNDGYRVVAGEWIRFWVFTLRAA